MPSITSPATSRAEWYDRSPADASIAGSVAPGANAQAATNVATYTVPAGKKAFAQTAEVQVGDVNQVALAAGTLNFALIRFTPSGGSAKDLLSSNVYAGEKADSSAVKTMALNFWMGAGDVLAIRVGCGANAGASLELIGSVKITEYAA